ncbi:amidohydrolase [Halolamina salifodinae]|uniref:Putative amidohydrolase YtcJ n=1 Tax=Halolamina salifodinae TaxID=1202767 RepID=A0A8T4GZ62_9EURY|nr:amidohydrolase [Halolamina salifodinae]MBP1986665.1 putative amidohydrolase YtcJ [Halolamina salifodinae]
MTDDTDTDRAVQADDHPASVLAYADTVLVDGEVLTVDEQFSIAEAVAVRDGRVLDMGTTAQIRDLAGPETEEIDLDGRTVIPGLIDSHCHLRQVGMDLERVTFHDAREIDDVLAAVGDAADETPDGEWVQASWGWHESQLAEDRLPTRTELDGVAPDNPVFIPRGGHVAVLNSAAFDRVGIDEDTPDPDGGTIVRDPETGRATGVLLEHARTELAEPELPDRGYAEFREDVTRGMAELNGRGVTAVLEPGVEPDVMRAYQSVAAADEATLRVDALVRVYEADDVTEKARHFARDFGDEFLKVGGVKYMLDGAVEGGRLSEPYEIVEGVQEQADYHGHYLWPPGGEEELVEMFRRAAELGHQVQTHVVGDAAIETLLDAYEAVDEEVDISDLRWTAMHLFLPTDEHLERMADLGVLATLQNHPTYLGRNMEKLWGEERAERAIPLKTVVDSPVLAGGGTDAPVVPWYPFDSLWWMISRQTVTAGELGPEEALSREAALRLWTMGSAYTMGWEEELGSLEPGKRADLAVLDTDYMDCSPAELRETDVELTMVGGDVVHED